MIRRIEDIVPPDRPKETWAPPVNPSIPDHGVRDTRALRRDEQDIPEDPRIDHELPLFREREGEGHEEQHIDDPPPFVSRILPREIGENAFFERKREERAPLRIPTGPRRGFLQTIRRYLLPIALVTIVLIYLVLSITFHHVSVSVTPKAERVVLNAHIAAKKDSTDGLSFSVFSLSATRTKDIVAGETKNMSIKASGKIVVYNEYSATSQRLIKNTRFQAANSLIYRIAESIVVPGLTTVDGKTVPGRIEVTVYADEPGEKWNIPLTDFNIPGLKGDPRFQKMYARSKTPMTGGWVGEMRVVGEDALANARGEIENALKEDLRIRAHESTPESFVLYDEGTYIVSRPLIREDLKGSEGMVRLTGEATMYAIMFPRTQLSTALAKDAVPAYDGAPVSVEEVELLRASVTPKTDEDPWTAQSVSLTLTGDTTIVWDVDMESLEHALVGKSKSEFESILRSIPSIDNANAEFRPFWWPGRFPKSLDRISAEIEEN